MEEKLTWVNGNNEKCARANKRGVYFLKKENDIFRLFNAKSITGVRVELYRTATEESAIAFADNHNNRGK